jgi:hypothetical protein
LSGQFVADGKTVRPTASADCCAVVGSKCCAVVESNQILLSVYYMRYLGWFGGWRRDAVRERSERTPVD